MGKLDGKVAIITGATSGMGLASAKLFVDEGAYVFITGRRKEQLDAAVKEIGRDVTGVQGDSGNLSDLDRLYETVKAKRGHVDIIFANAGIGDLDKPLGTISPEAFDATFNVNVRGTLFTVQKALPLLRDGASLILNGSVVSVRGNPGASVYAASKAALRSFARTWTVELKSRHIRVNIIQTGPIGDIGTFARFPDDVKNFVAGQIPAGRLGLSIDIAAAALFLASSDSGFVTGSELYVDGGLSQV
jgi:NAD(P)-dependent dehydrogenase (short-subunit alcohol dehydrogenase family)